MRWLQWSQINLETGLGGVEVYARSVTRELRKRGIEVQFSSDPKALKESNWDVIQTHGSSVPFFEPPQSDRAIRIHSLHGETWGRMKACREFFWPGGYLASSKEHLGVLRSDIVLACRKDFRLIEWAKKRQKQVQIIPNGWNSAEITEPEALTQFENQKPFFLFLGRGRDVVKGAERLGDFPEKLVAIPGEGFEKDESVFSTGRLEPSTVASAFFSAQGLVVPSLYEGNSLAILEALGWGLPVLATPVGAVPEMLGQVQGLVALGHDLNWTEALIALKEFPLDPESRKHRAVENRRVLLGWEAVVDQILSAVEDFKRMR